MLSALSLGLALLPFLHNAPQTIRCAILSVRWPCRRRSKPRRRGQGGGGLGQRRRGMKGRRAEGRRRRLGVGVERREAGRKEGDGD
eukprot:scaffold180909_cov18-Tisochrysis_lutea.AAC.1